MKRGPGSAAVPAVWLLVIFATAAAADNRNAATWYDRAYGSLGRLTEADWNLVRSYGDDPAAAPSPQLREILATMTGAMEVARRGARLPHADYDLDYGQGFELLLPHLPRSRDLTRLLRADALVRLHDGDATGATERINTIVGMSRQLPGDRTMISSLVAQANWRVADEVLQAALDRGAVSADDSATLLASLNGLPGIDPFGYVESVAMEQDIVVASLERHFDEESDLSGLGDVIPIDAPATEELRDMSRETFDADLEKYGVVMDRLVEIFVVADREEGQAALAELQEELEAGEHGVIAQLVVPGLHKVFALKHDAEEQLAARRAALEALAAGVADPAAQANAAIWYMRAADQLADRDAAALAALRLRDASPDRPMDEQLERLLEDPGDVWTLLAEAAEIPRCDFAFARRRGPVPLETAPSYAPGLRDLLRLVVVDAAWRLERGETSVLGERLHVAWSMLGHFERDPVFVTAIMTHDAFGRVVPLTARSANTVDADRRGDLWALANRLSRRDPFGYVGATTATRKTVEELMLRALPPDADAKTRAEVTKTARGLEAARLLDVTVVVESSRRTDPAEDAVEAVRLAPLGDTLDLEAVERLGLEAPALSTALETHRPQAVAEMELEDAGNLRERSRRARADLRHGLAKLRVLRPQGAAGAGAGGEPR